MAVIQMLALREDHGNKVCSAETGEHSTFTWIDGLCWPVGLLACKKTDLQKIRHVYQDSLQVLVLDASREAHKANEMHVLAP